MISFDNAFLCSGLYLLLDVQVLVTVDGDNGPPGERFRVEIFLIWYSFHCKYMITKNSWPRTTLHPSVCE